MNRQPPYDIYQTDTPDTDNDFTPQVAIEMIEERRRDLRRSRIVFVCTGIVLLAALTALIILITTDFIKETTRLSVLDEPSENPSALPFFTLPSRIPETTSSAPEILSAARIREAAYYTVAGQQAFGVNDADRALEHFLKAVDIIPGLQGIHQNIGSIYLQKNLYPEAVMHLEKALEEDETFDLLFNLGAVCMVSEEYEKAERYLLAALERRPENPDSHRTLALLYREMKNEEKALFFFEKYLERRPDDFNTLKIYAVYLVTLEKYEEAGILLSVLIEELPHLAPAYFLHARVLIKTEQTEEALSALETGVQRVDPGVALSWLQNEEFDPVRSSPGFRQIVETLEEAGNRTF